MYLSYSFVAINIVEILVGKKEIKMVVNTNNRCVAIDLKDDDVVKTNYVISKDEVKTLLCSNLLNSVAGLLKSQAI